MENEWMNPPKPTAIVVGAGLSGLTAAYRLHKAGWNVKVLEAGDGVGGRVQTVTKGGYVMDTGATVICASYHAYMNLAEEIGLDKQMTATTPYVGVVRNGCIHELDIRHMARSTIKTQLFSVRSKVLLLRVIVDLVRARSKGLLDYSDMRKSAPLDTESARDYVLRTVNAEINDYLCEPMVRTMLLANSNKASKVEFFSALTNGFGNRFLYLNGGLNRFARDLAQHLDIRLQSPATRVADHGDHVAVTWQTQGLDPETQKATACVVSCPLPVANRICEGYAAILQPLNEKLDYTQSIAVGIGSTVVPDARAFLVQLSSRESKEIAVLVLEHNKASNLAPEGHGMITALWETDAATRYLAKDDATIIAKTLETVFKVFPEIKGYVDVTHVTRWPLALPFTQVGAYRAIDAFNARINPASRVQFAADFMSAAGQNTAVEFGTRAARTIDSAFGK